jgi:Rps23 Pro-64 3,4-dihydroxylase Tpa1-like proline 4-hydroxylase
VKTRFPSLLSNSSCTATTCILYLNPEWVPGDGGELQLVPFLKRPVRIAPKHDRLAVFLSDRVLHRVLPANKERFCLTVVGAVQAIESG